MQNLVKNAHAKSNCTIVADEIRLSFIMTFMAVLNFSLLCTKFPVARTRFDSREQLLFFTSSSF